MSYPYQNFFLKELESKLLKESTIRTYDTILESFFRYQSFHNDQFKLDQSADSIVTQNIRSYFDTLDNELDFSDNTYNRNLTAINSYFKYLYKNKLINFYPVFDVKYKLLSARELDYSDLWLDDLSSILLNDLLYLQSRLVILLLSKGISINRMASEGFYRSLSQISFNDNEKAFIDVYMAFRDKLSEKHNNNPNLFLIQHKTLKNNQSGDSSVCCQSVHSLYRYLEKDGKKIGFEFKPGVMLKQVVLRYMENNPSAILSDIASSFEIPISRVLMYKKELLLRESNQT